MAGFDDQSFDGVRYEHILRLAAWIGLPVAFLLAFGIALPATGDAGQAAAIAALPAAFSAPFFGVIVAFGILRLRAVWAARSSVGRLAPVLPVLSPEPNTPAVPTVLDLVGRAHEAGL